MWSKNKPPNDSHRDQTTLISATTEVIGDVMFTGTMHIEGRVRGNIRAEQGVLVVSHSARIDGDICVPRVVINGVVSGSVYAADYLELAAKAVITGNVHYQVVEIAKGAQVNGRLEYHASELPAVRQLLHVATVDQANPNPADATGTALSADS